MKKAALFLVVSVLAPTMFSGNVARAAEGGHSPQPPLVSSAWVESHAKLPNHVVVDVRTVDEYAAGHIPGSVNIPFVVPLSAWITTRDDLLLELPARSDLFRTLGNSGIAETSKVVVVTGVDDPPYAQAGGTRVALTLMYAGLRDVSVLDGGYPRWVADGRATTTAVPSSVPVTFDGVPGGVQFVGIDDVRAAVGRATILDARDADVYSGDVVEPYANKAGHLPTAVSAPTRSFFNADGTYQSVRELQALVGAAIGYDRGKEVIAYCGVGGYASATVFVLTRVLGYRNVKFYDGSAQEWVKHFDMEL